MTDWRIDELAQRAGIAVDTIRFYQREGLLASGERNGRTRRFGPEHLERLERIRAFQARRFSLAAIRALLAQDDQEGVASLLLGGEEDTYDFDELLETTGLDAELARQLKAAGVLRDPAEHGRAAYDADDAKVLRAVADLQRLRVGDEHLLEIAQIYTEGLEEIQRRVGKVIGAIAAEWRVAHPLEQAAPPSAAEFERLARDLRVLSDYTNRRTLQRKVLHRIELDAAEALDDDIEIDDVEGLTT